MDTLSSPLVCVCIPCYNAERTIIETLRSLQKQTYTNFEIHVFDNASEDKTVELVRSIADERVYLHLAEETGTAESNFTRCLNLGRGEYTAIYHADDLYDPTIIEKEVKFLVKNKEACGVLTFATQIDSQGQRLKTFLAPKSLGLSPGESRIFDVKLLFKAVLKHDNFLFCPSAMMRTSVCVNHIKTWRGDLFKSSADLDVWFRLADLGGIGLLNEPLLFYRISDMQWTASYRKKRTTQSDTFLVLDAWMKKEGIKQTMKTSDAINYQKLQRYDMLGCMLNAVRNNEIGLARDVWLKSGVFSFVTELLQMDSTRDFKFFALSSILKMMLVPLMGEVLRYLFLKHLNKVRL